MKPFFVVALRHWLLVAGLLAALPHLAPAQCTVNTPPCATPFVATDVLTGQPVQALCVGRAVRFAPACGRVVPANLLYYNVLATASLTTTTTPAGCNFVPGQLAGNTFTPTVDGPVTVSELANPDPTSGTSGVGTVYVRNFMVYSTPVPNFSLTPCANNRVNVNLPFNLTDNRYDQYYIQVDNGPVLGPYLPNASPNLAAPAGSRITLIGSHQANATCTSQATLTVPALSTQPLVITRLTAQTALPGTLVFEFSGLSDYYQNSLQRADAATPARFRGITGFVNPTTITLGGLQPAGLYRLARYDVCNTDSAFSVPVPTVELSGASTNNVNNLTWQAAGPVAGYTLLRNGTALATLPGTATSYADAAVTCGTRYTYRLQATVNAASQSISNEVAVQTVSTLPPAAPLLNASFTLTNQVLLSASLAGGAALPPGAQLSYSRQGGPANVDFAVVPAATDTLRDPAAPAALLAAPPCYTVRLQDVCGNTSVASPPTCPSLLTATAADADGLTVRLSWSAFRGPGSPAQPASYRVLSLAADGTVLAASATTASLTYLDQAPPPDRQVVRYRVEVRGAGLPSGTVSYSNVASLARRPRLVVPNAFTPNGDGLNDVLELKGRYLNDFVFVVIDRSGQEVFRATDRTQTWDGTIRGHAPVNAVYVWRLTMQDETGQPFSQTSTVTILK